MTAPAKAAEAGNTNKMQNAAHSLYIALHQPYNGYCTMEGKQAFFDTR
jgi:hypothetical protein